MVPLQLFIGVGTVVNVATVVVGSLLGMFVGDKLSERSRRNVTDALGLMTIVIGALSVKPILEPALSDAVGDGVGLIVVLISLLIGTLLGSAWAIEDRLGHFGSWLRTVLMRGRQDDSSVAQHRFVDGFVTASLVFCVGPLVILGSLSDGMGRGADQLLAKAILDGFAALAFASSLGIGVLASALTVAVIQGSLTLVGFLLGDIMAAAQIDALSIVGGVILIGLGLRLLELKQVRVADMLPALLVAPLLVVGITALP